MKIPPSLLFNTAVTKDFFFFLSSNFHPKSWPHGSGESVTFCQSSAEAQRSNQHGAGLAIWVQCRQLDCNSNLCMALGTSLFYMRLFSSIRINNKGDSIFYLKRYFSINIQKSVACLYTNNEISERESNKAIPFKITSPQKKYLGINLSR